MIETLIFITILFFYYSKIVQNYIYKESKDLNED